MILDACQLYWLSLKANPKRSAKRSKHRAKINRNSDHVSCKPIRLIVVKKQVKIIKFTATNK